MAVFKSISVTEAQQLGMERLTRWLDPTVKDERRFFKKVMGDLDRNGSAWELVRRKGRPPGRKKGTPSIELHSIWRIMPEGVTLDEGE